MMSEFDEDVRRDDRGVPLVCKNTMIEESLGKTEPEQGACEKVPCRLEHFVLYKRQLGEYKCVATHTVEAFVDSPPRITVGDVLPERRYEKTSRSAPRGERMPAVALKPGATTRTSGASSRRSAPLLAPGDRSHCAATFDENEVKLAGQGRGDHPRRRGTSRPRHAAFVDADHLGLKGARVPADRRRSSRCCSLWRKLGPSSTSSY